MNDEPAYRQAGKEQGMLNKEVWKESRIKTKRMRLGVTATWSSSFLSERQT
jgi:hypothetical protein